LNSKVLLTVIELPPDWEEAKDEDGDIYYWNVETDVTQYEIPTE